MPRLAGLLLQTLSVFLLAAAYVDAFTVPLLPLGGRAPPSALRHPNGRGGCRVWLRSSEPGKGPEKEPDMDALRKRMQKLDTEAAWQNAEEYDSGISESSEMTTSEEVNPSGDDWLQGGSLFDPSNRPMTGRERIQEQEFQAVNAFSNETGFKLAIVGIALLAAFYISVFTSGGIDGSNRVLPESYSACDNEADPSCRYN